MMDVLHDQRGDRTREMPTIHLPLSSPLGHCCFCSPPLFFCACVCFVLFLLAGNEARARVCLMIMKRREKTTGGWVVAGEGVFVMRQRRRRGRERGKVINDKIRAGFFSACWCWVK